MRTTSQALIDYNNDPTVDLLKTEIILVHMRALSKNPLIRYQFDFKEQRLVEIQSTAYDEAANRYADMLYKYGQTYYPELFPQDEAES